jgi:hypothetical protein
MAAMSPQLKQELEQKKVAWERRDEETHGMTRLRVKMDAHGMGARGELQVYTTHTGQPRWKVSRVYTYTRGCKQPQLKPGMMEELKDFLEWRKHAGSTGFTWFVGLLGMVAFAMYAQGQKRQTRIVKARLHYFATAQVSVLSAPATFEPQQFDRHQFEQGLRICLDDLQKKEEDNESPRKNKACKCESAEAALRADNWRLKARIRELEAEKKRLKAMSNPTQGVYPGATPEYQPQATLPRVKVELQSPRSSTDRRPHKRQRTEMAQIDTVSRPLFEKAKTSLPMEDSGTIPLVSAVDTNCFLPRNLAVLAPSQPLAPALSSAFESESDFVASFFFLSERVLVDV